ncbi:uncharacterized [Tachysurus ichikawai]
MLRDGGVRYAAMRSGYGTGVFSDQLHMTELSLPPCSPLPVFHFPAPFIPLSFSIPPSKLVTTPYIILTPVRDSVTCRTLCSFVFLRG